jgi:selenocysteine lyase/cysteine desulfurase
MSSRNHQPAPTISRRDFARVAAFGSSAAIFTPLVRSQQRPEPLPPTPASPDERFWAAVRGQFVLAPGLIALNAANLCPSSHPALESLIANTRDIDQDPSFDNRAKMTAGKEATRKLLAGYLRVTPEEIVITRNTSEANNLVSNGIDLKEGDEVIIFSDNHPSNHTAWTEKAKRFRFTVQTVHQVNPHPGAEYYLEAFSKAITPRTRVLAFTHLTNTVGDLLPARELCLMARERGILTLVDGAQSLGLMDVDLSDMQPDFYSGSAHKWPCGPKECGVLYVHKSAQSRIWPTIYSAYPGAVGISRTFEAFGQRDEPAMIAFGEALRFLDRIGRPVIERRGRELAQALMEGLRRIEGVKIWTHPDPERSVAVVSFQPGNLDLRKLSAALYQKDRIAGATRGGSDRGGLRLSPHLYNTHADIDRTIAAIKRYLSTGL